MFVDKGLSSSRLCISMKRICTGTVFASIGVIFAGASMRNTKSYLQYTHRIERALEQEL